MVWHAETVVVSYQLRSAYQSIGEGSLYEIAVKRWNSTNVFARSPANCHSFCKKTRCVAQTHRRNGQRFGHFVLRGDGMIMVPDAVP